MRSTRYYRIGLIASAVLKLSELELLKTVAPVIVKPDICEANGLDFYFPDDKPLMRISLPLPSSIHVSGLHKHLYLYIFINNITSWYRGWYGGRVTGVWWKSGPLPLPIWASHSSYSHQSSLDFNQYLLDGVFQLYGDFVFVKPCNTKLFTCKMTNKWVWRTRHACMFSASPIHIFHCSWKFSIDMDHCHFCEIRNFNSHSMRTSKHYSALVPRRYYLTMVKMSQIIYIFQNFAAIGKIVLNLKKKIVAEKNLLFLKIGRHLASKWFLLKNGGYWWQRTISWKNMGFWGEWDCEKIWGVWVRAIHDILFT